MYLSRHKYSTFNLSHWNKHKYIEFRIAGGKYSSKVTDILQSIDRYVYVMNIACSPDLFKEEYYKKLYGFFNKLKKKDQQFINHFIDKIFFKTKIRLSINDSPQMSEVKIKNIKSFFKNKNITIPVDEQNFLNDFEKKYIYQQQKRNFEK